MFFLIVITKLLILRPSYSIPFNNEIISQFMLPLSYKIDLCGLRFSVCQNYENDNGSFKMFTLLATTNVMLISQVIFFNL